MDKFECLKLAQAGPEGRVQVNRDELSALIADLVVQMEEATAGIRAALFLSGMLDTDFYYSKAKKSAFTTEETKVLPRVRWDERHGTPNFQWEILTRRAHPIAPGRTPGVRRPGAHGYIAYVRKGNSKTKSKMYVTLSSKTVPLRKGTDGISPTTFNKEPDWAQIAGEDAEAKLRILRKQEKQLADIRRRLAVFKQLMQRSEQ